MKKKYKSKKRELYWITNYDTDSYTNDLESGFIVVATSPRQAQNIYRKFVNESACFDNYTSYGRQPSKTNKCVYVRWAFDELKNGVNGILNIDGIIPTDQFNGWHSSGVNKKKQREKENKVY